MWIPWGIHISQCIWVSLQSYGKFLMTAVFISVVKSIIFFPIPINIQTNLCFRVQLELGWVGSAALVSSFLLLAVVHSGQIPSCHSRELSLESWQCLHMSKYCEGLVITYLVFWASCWPPVFAHASLNGFITMVYHKRLVPWVQRCCLSVS